MAYLDDLNQFLSTFDFAGAQAAAPPAPNLNGLVNDADLMADPAYQAFLRESGLQEANLQGEAARRREAANRRMALAASNFEENKLRSGQNIDNSYESRGLRGAGANSVDRARSAADIDRQRLQFETDTNESLNDSLAGINQQTLSLAAQRAQERAAAAARLSQSRMQNIVNTHQTQQLQQQAAALA